MFAAIAGMLLETTPRVLLVWVLASVVGSMNRNANLARSRLSNSSTIYRQGKAPFRRFGDAFAPRAPAGRCGPLWRSIAPPVWGAGLGWGADRIRHRSTEVTRDARTLGERHTQNKNQAFSRHKRSFIRSDEGQNPKSKITTVARPGWAWAWAWARTAACSGSARFFFRWVLRGALRAKAPTCVAARSRREK